MAVLDESALRLPPRYLAMVREVLREHLPGLEVWAYGSRVGGDSYEASDLDLVARQPGDLTRASPNLWAAQEAFVASDLPIQVQLVDWARIPDTFHDEIEAAYVVIQRPTEDANFSKTVSNGMNL